jgi:pyruvate dehydrogenase E2 component (dihydrolipoamide acetyltransferase)
VKGSGPGGRIVREDVLKAVEELKKPAGPSAAPVQMRTATVSKTVRLSGKRKATAERLSYSARTTVPATISMDVSMEAALRHKENLTKTTGKAISVTAYAVKASAKALQDYPIVNSSLEGDEVKIYSDVNVAVAIHAPDGLVAPVIPNADKKSIAEITKQIRDLTERATQNALSVSDVTGGTFTVSNLGGYGVDIFAPVMNPPQSAILGLGRTSERAAIVDKQVRVVPITTISLVFDHRIVDGVPAAQFLQRIKELLEAPEKLD